MFLNINVSKNSSVRSCQRMSFVFPISSSHGMIVNAEVLFTASTFKHNIPFEAAAHAGHSLLSMFPECEVAKNRDVQQQKQLQ